jgi:hypothetical protein
MSMIIQRGLISPSTRLVECMATQDPQVNIALCIVHVPGSKGQLLKHHHHHQILLMMSLSRHHLHNLLALSG